MKKLLQKQQREEFVAICKLWLSDNLTDKDVANTIDKLDSAILTVLGYTCFEDSYEFMRIDEILWMDSISDEEKGKEINRLLAMGIPKSRIAREMGISRFTLYKYLEKIK